MKNKILSFFSRFKLHFAFWGLVSILFMSLNLSSSGHSGIADMFTSLVEFLISVCIPVYVNLIFFIPLFFHERKFVQYALVVISFIVLFTLALCVVEIYILGMYKNFNDPHLFRHLFMTNLVIITIFVVTTSSLKLSKKWYMNRAEMQRLRLEKAEAELQFLRTQVNPHFLFNTLNNIYALVLSKENDKAGGMILKLSDIMDYMIHDSKAESVLLQTEINHIGNYLDLEKIRLTGQDHIDFVSQTDADHYRIAPFILLPFIENGFKHGISNTINNGYIKINIHAASGVLKFKVENSKPASSDKSINNGIGLSNIKRRLEIIYPGKHELEILDNPCSFKVSLSVRLDEN